MDNIINLIPAGSWNGVVGFQDCLNQIYMIQAQTSWRSTPEQNRKLEESLYAVYLAYLQDIASANGGYY